MKNEKNFYRASEFFNLLLNLVIILFFFVFFYTLTTLKIRRLQPDREEALNEGLGFYSEKESLGCTNETGNCQDPGVETFIQNCIPHPKTKKGCLDKDGRITYEKIISKNPCEIQCVSSKFNVFSSIDFDSEEQVVGTFSEINSRGCNKVIDDFGIDQTDFFLGKLQNQGNVPPYYPLKTVSPKLISVFIIKKKKNVPMQIIQVQMVVKLHAVLIKL